eukprot:6403380-Pyramimonas_sp.AAC.1
MPTCSPCMLNALVIPGGGHGGDPCQETPCLLPGCLGFPGFRRFGCGKRDAPAPKINGRPGVS